MLAQTFSFLADPGDYSATTLAVITVGVVAAVAASVPDHDYGMPEPDDVLPWEWNAYGVASYWSRRPVAVARRSLTVTLAALSVGLALFIDRAQGQAGCIAAIASHVPWQQRGTSYKALAICQYKNQTGCAISLCPELCNLISSGISSSCFE